MKSSDPTQSILGEIAVLRLKADEANSSAHTLVDLILEHQPRLISDTTVVREAATLLLHAVQNFSRIAEAAVAK